MPLKPKTIKNAVEKAEAKLSAKRPWLVVITQPRREGLFLDQLRFGEFEIYRPMTLVSRDARYVKGGIPEGCTDSGHKRVLVPEALFPGYVFLRPQYEDYQRLSGLPGLSFVMQEAMPHMAVSRMRKLESDGFIAVIGRTDPDHDKIAIGDRVQTLDGLFEFIVSETDGGRRVAGLCAFMNGNSRVSVPLHRVVKVA